MWVLRLGKGLHHRSLGVSSGREESLHPDWEAERRQMSGTDASITQRLKEETVSWQNHKADRCVESTPANAIFQANT